ncbi:CDP-archaeol synthase [Ruminococcus sp.]|uniref:CDP-archaeol synthase n=1 Tax=Ruminococcus sp. TaxID=41978 RepID=UPI0025F640AB|nr:CDP-archaeol synthase [Ruminococcus sp.]MBQ8966888.1 CDP-archaeol synthase [Ruminococcus sp.]
MIQLAEMYVTLMGLIMAGIMNMIFTKTPYFKKSHPPMDGGRNFRDGRRIFGDNKSWKGFWGMTVCCGISQTAWGLISRLSPTLTARNRLYQVSENTLLYNLAIGLLFGFVYVLFELPNSFIKRRLDITPGKTAKGGLGVLFFIIDQIDSLLGVTLCLAIICGFSFWEYWAYILVGGLTHIVINLSLYALRIRRNV